METERQPFVQPGTYPLKLHWTWAYLGWWRTALVVIGKPLERLLSKALPGASLRYQDFTESLFDSRYGVRTHARIQLDALTDIPEDALDGANEYGPTRVMDFGYVMSKLALDHPRYDLLDIGSGHGKVLLLAMRFPFRSLRGIELSEGLHRVAQQNLQAYTGPRIAGNVELILGNALEADFPAGDFVCFMFNPFNGEVLQSFLAHLEASIAEHPRHVIVVYGNSGPDHVEVLEASSVLHARPAGEDTQYIVYETASVVV